jgi:peptidyl-prolyl cis-trans isomerase C
MALVWPAVALALALPGCAGTGKDERRQAQRQADARVGGAVISTIDGHPITVGDVQDLVTHSRLAPDEALRRLQAERLLMLEADRREFGRAPAVAQVARQARVQALLDAATEGASVSDADVLAAYEKAKGRFDRPERRAAVHVLARLPASPTPEADAAARAFAADMIAPLAATQDVRGFLSALRGKKAALFGIKAEALPPVARNGRFVEEFLAAMFALNTPGVVPEPIRTVYGWHAIRLVRIEPAYSTPYAEAAAQLRAELLIERKKQIVDQLIADARKKNRIELAGKLRETLAKLEL